MDKDLLERRARFVYEACRLHAQYLGCPVVPAPFDEREEDFRKQFFETIQGYMEELYDDITELAEKGISEEEQRKAHDSWMERYFEMGWKYGEEYNPEKRTHPDLVPYDELDPKEKIKDEVFLWMVIFAKKYIW